MGGEDIPHCSEPLIRYALADFLPRGCECNSLN
jgi:hypothetical protein